jgi:hypothetical protein
MKLTVKTLSMLIVLLAFTLTIANPAQATSRAQEQSTSFAPEAIPQPLIAIDPALTWNTFLGGNDGDYQYSIAVDQDRNIYVTGFSSSTWGTPIRNFSSDWDAYVAKLSPSGNLIWNTFLGSSGGDSGHAVAVDESGNVYVAGQSNSTWGNPIRAHSGNSAGGVLDVFVAKLSPSGSLIWNTFLGSKNNDLNPSITVDGDGNVYTAGESYVTWGSPVRAFSGSFDAFAAKLSSSGNLVWNTFLGSADNDFPYSVTVDGDGNLYVGGTSSATWDSPVRAYSGVVDGFVAKLSSSGSLTWNTFLGCSDYDSLQSVVVDGSNNVYVAGSSPATWDSPVRAYSGGDSDAFVAKLGASGSLTWNTFLGGSHGDYGFSIAMNSTGNLYVLGESDNTWGDPVQPYSGGVRDGFTAKVDPSGNLTWNTFVGGNGDDQVRSLVLDQNENIHIAGFSDATWGTPIRAYAANLDGFVAVMRDHTFADVSTSHWAWDFIERLYANGITGGCGGGNYCPTSTVTRAQMAVFLLVAEHSTGYTPPPAAGIFNDVPADNGFAKWIEALAAEGITGGCGGGNYCPNTPVTREQMAVFLLVAEHGTGYTPPTATGVFNDVPADYPFAPWIEALAAEGITGGCGGGNFCPKGTVTRAQMAVFLVAAFNLP